MGNHISCMSPAASQYKQNLIKILHSETGNVSELEAPLTAAELMLEFPAQFLCCVSNATLTGRRICAVPADEELRPLELYMLLPMHKLNTRFSAEDMTFLAALASLQSKKSSMARSSMPHSKVAPLIPASSLSAAPLSASTLSADQSSNSEDFRAQLSIGSQSFKQSSASVSMNMQEPPPFMRGACNTMMCRSKSWIPKLETITEAHAIF